ncbi:MAG: hypothetical protein A3G52_02115 [Candidatus Taylorbacteria bacterium RIFCSPLOWO2_12_FULL_43_20]|uniref:GIY-YIG domain-containing protein n=1 Tax=Candidatus Taylorbacteria bacterium RIFCSPLOWO2_12_FULL_43_20 TaxID=1802332 RepID=A0A1G2P564_9BACT|nr:MAG: hypothetical protein A2825_01000 [Candidatus Taylorbacteria bacterium RIFCSPHIGHO2_01_FULL_43_120]OHA23594.1 MAG: hypothetical protein A3B98_00445 [Candidatus Taylorbacteria bacterium RIFCSPHIGHO2_02_FULL_43_55]OHA28962.1 MAG: hypothetical protein A3E92_04430 [Candidatus Taylorbacteria bacterium RIFCSPHIGHO2_12_FULL_42_34]OHA30299.1 MAG: hypothetical protein A3B09_03915 [Candidatus Taylorbacteria bacterium RIFCSPLOWO2_01_FULL_43_83]OHA39355.1 MAG: hypothetical protein A3H58_04080 [Candi
MYTTYIIQNNKDHHYYIGSTSDINKRIEQHNSNSNRSTKGRGQWQLVYSEEFDNKKSAWLRERQIKSYKGGNAFKRLVEKIDNI